MLFSVATKTGNVELTSPDLVELLAGKLVKAQNREDFEALSMDFLRLLQIKGVIHEVSLQQLTLMSFAMGYHYKVFHDKNSVEVINESDSGNQPNDKASSD